MRNRGQASSVGVILGLLVGIALRADTVTLAGLPAGDVDTISIQLDPINGALTGPAGEAVGWGFVVNWTSTNSDWVSFTGTSLGSVAQSETNPSLVGSYTDLIGSQGGPVDYGLGPGKWAEAFNGVSQGVGIYEITLNSGAAVPGAQDTGQITFNFQVYDGDPLKTGMQIGDASYSYYGASTEFSVQVAGTPEPATGLLFLATAGIFVVCIRRVG